MSLHMRAILENFATDRASMESRCGVCCGAFRHFCCPVADADVGDSREWEFPELQNSATDKRGNDT
jgi:hypothetical protein